LADSETWKNEGGNPEVKIQPNMMKMVSKKITDKLISLQRKGEESGEKN